MLRLADENPFITGVVGWVDLRSLKLRTQIESFGVHPKFVGVRHVVQDEPDDEFMMRPEFLRGIEILAEYSLAYDILIFPKQLPAAIQMARKFPNQRFVLDHIAKPNVREETLEPWRAQIRELAKSPNVECKLSGMVTEAKWREWKEDGFRPYLDVVWEAFGEDRLMIGSDWPVCLLSGAYKAVMGIAEKFLGQFSVAAREKVLGGNAVRFYKLRFD